MHVIGAAQYQKDIRSYTSGGPMRAALEDEDEPPAAPINDDDDDDDAPEPEPEVDALVAARDHLLEANNNTNDALAAAVASLLAEAKAQRAAREADRAEVRKLRWSIERLRSGSVSRWVRQLQRGTLGATFGAWAEAVREAVRSREADEAAEERIERRMRQWRLAKLEQGLRRWEANKESLARARRLLSKVVTKFRYRFVLLVWDGWLTLVAEGRERRRRLAMTAVRALGRVLHTCFLGWRDLHARRRAVRSAAVAAAAPLRRARVVAALHFWQTHLARTARSF